MAESRLADLAGPSRLRRVLAVLAMVAGVIVWLWPIGLGGRMPLGGDVTQFFLGLMAVLARAIRAGRLPLWNDLWGYGFPGLAESQMGVFYPPHWILYGGLSLEQAYAASLVLHTIWGALGTSWAAREFSTSPEGAALAGFAWGTSGFFVIHLPHQWGYTVGSWMPWAWGLAWRIVQGPRSPRTPVLLALVLALQVLPGHFQLAFCTQAGVLVLVLGGAGLSKHAWGRLGRAALAVLAALPLAALQLWPTFLLARLASSRRDFEYLSGFAASPLHLVSYVAPGLFQRSPLWRPLAWDPFHTSPEEHLAYLGLVPLFLAAGTIVHGFRREPAVRALTVVAIVTLIFSLGPYVPGFELLCKLPGFSFFRAPARWALATGLALALLAGKGFDAWRSWPRPGRSLARFVALAGLAPALIILGGELALASTRGPGWEPVVRAFEGTLNQLPWSRVRVSSGREPSFRDLMAIARRPQQDSRVQAVQARRGVLGADSRFVRQRFAIYAEELGGTGVLLLALLVLSRFSRRPRSFATALGLLSAVDLWSVGGQRAVDLGSIRPLTVQSRVLALLSREPRGTRTADPTHNLPMVAGASPIAAYRTLDLPALTALTLLAQAPVGGTGPARPTLEALRASGTGLRLLDPFEPAPPPGSRLPGWGTRVSVLDPELAGWLHGKDLVAALGERAARFTVWRPGPSGTLAWRVPLTPGRTPAILKSWSGRAAEALEVFEHARPLATRRPRPERLDIEVPAAGPEPSIVVVSQLAAPGWRAWWDGPEGSRPSAIVPVFSRPGEIGWQGVESPGPGPWRLRMEYQSRDVEQGLAVSGAAWTVWGLLFWRLGRSSKAPRDLPP